MAKETRVETVEIAGLSAGVSDDWSRVLETTPVDPVFGTPIWAEEWWTHLGRTSDRLRISRVFEGRELVGLAPLYVGPEAWSGLTARVLAPVGRTTAEYADLAVPPEQQTATALVDSLLDMGGWDVLSLSRLPQDSPTGAAMIEAARRLDLNWLEENEQDSPFLVLEGSFQDYLAARFSSNFRNRIRRMTKRMAALGGHRFEMVTDRTRLAEVFERMVEVENLSWKGSQGLGIFNSPERRAFFRAVADRLADQGRLAVHLQWSGDNLAAYHFGFIAAGRYYDYNLAFDPRFSRQSPGLVSLADLLDRCWSDGLRIFDFLRGAEEYKALWTDTASRNVNLHLFAPTAKGRALALGRKARLTARRVKRAAKGRPRDGEAVFRIMPRSGREQS